MREAAEKGWGAAAPASGYKYVRRVRGGWQARVVQEGAPSGAPRVNLGIYPNPREAWQAVVRYARTGRLPPNVLPTYVKRRPDGRFFAEVRRNRRAVLVGPVAGLAECERLLAAALAELPPRPRRAKPEQLELFEGVAAVVTALPAEVRPVADRPTSGRRPRRVRRAGLFDTSVAAA